MRRFLPVVPETYVPHALHRPGSPWPETNCWTDAAIELLHALDLEPLAVSGVAVAADFEGDQWQMYKFPQVDVLEQFGIEIHEFNPYRSLDAHVLDLMARDRLTIIEVDAWFLPDTGDMSYRAQHLKTSIVPNGLDVDARRIEYFHNSGYHVAEGDDFDGLLRLGRYAGTQELAPYTEVVVLDDVHRPSPEEAAARALALLVGHRDRRPRTNPVDRWAAYQSRELPQLVAGGDPAFHTYAFVTIRQCGAAADLAAEHCTWLAQLLPDHAEALGASAADWRVLSDGAKSLQMKLARVMRGRTADLDPIMAAMAEAWSSAQGHLDRLTAP